MVDDARRNYDPDPQTFDDAPAVVNEEDGLAREARQVPLALRIVVCICLLGGGMLFAEAAASYIKSNGRRGDEEALWAIFLFFLAWGLFRLQEWARIVAVVVRTCYKPDAGRPFRMAVSRPATGDKATSRPWWRIKFSIKSLLLATFIVSCMLARLTARDVLYENWDSSATAPATGSLADKIYYGGYRSRLGLRRDDLEYVVFRTGRVRPSMHAELGPTKHCLSFSTTGGDWVVVPGPQQLHEIVEGVHRTRSERVTLAELQSYLQSNRSEWSLDALVGHAKELREKEREQDGPR